MSKMIRFDIPGHTHPLALSTEFFSQNIEKKESSQYQELMGEYIRSHDADITRRLDVLVLYIDSFRKIFEKNISLVNQDAIKHIVSQPSAVNHKKSYIMEYLNSIKNGFKNASNDTIAIRQETIVLEEINLKEYELNIDKEFQQVNDALLKTAGDISAIGRAFGDPYIITSFDHKNYKAKRSEFEKADNIKDRYLVDIGFTDGIGRAELSIISFFKIGQEQDGNIDSR
jgi:hypothetical protein